MSKEEYPTAPELLTERWFNSAVDIRLADLRGKVVLVEAFQLLCPGCVQYGLPQATKAHRLFSRRDLIVLGLHSVFEHHDAQGPRTLEAFLHEYRIPFPVAVDLPARNGGPLPQTMARYQLRGTPSTLLIDRNGQLRSHHFGQVDDMHLGAEIMALIQEPATATVTATATASGHLAKQDPVMDEDGCGPDGCPIPEMGRR